MELQNLEITLNHGVDKWDVVDDLVMSMCERSGDMSNRNVIRMINEVTKAIHDGRITIKYNGLEDKN